ncbi:hypothetical protein Mapa_005103 [Marchantia paleacea]|nr:hypothetical protein Mapa_005103 [Marchantia paleacea]
MPAGSGFQIAGKIAQAHVYTPLRIVRAQWTRRWLPGFGSESGQTLRVVDHLFIMLLQFRIVVAREVALSRLRFIVMIAIAQVRAIDQFGLLVGTKAERGTLSYSNRTWMMTF